MLADLYDVDKALFSIRGSISKRRPWGFHLSKSDIYGPDGMGDRDYSVEHRRNKRSVSEESAGFDINVGAARERALVKYLVEIGRHYRDPLTGKSLLFEVIGPNEQGVAKRWGNPTNWQPVDARNDHDWHIHLSRWRDTLHVDIRPLFFEHFGISEYPVIADPEPIDPPDDPADPPAEPPPPTVDELQKQIDELEQKLDVIVEIASADELVTDEQP